MQLNAPDLFSNVVRLEVLEDRHLHTLREAGAIDAMWDWMPDIPKGLSFSNYADHVAECAASGDLVPFVIYRADDNAFAGVVAYEGISRIHRRLSINYFWHPETMRGTRVFPATQLLLIERAIAWGARRIEWALPSENTAALRAVESLGATREGQLRNYQRLADGRWSDIIVLSMLREEAEIAMRELARRITARDGT